jgi:hypothetical protein
MLNVSADSAIAEPALPQPTMIIRSHPVEPRPQSLHPPTIRAGARRALFGIPSREDVNDFLSSLETQIKERRKASVIG